MWNENTQHTLLQKAVLDGSYHSPHQTPLESQIEIKQPVIAADKAITSSPVEA